MNALILLNILLILLFLLLYYGRCFLRMQGERLLLHFDSTSIVCCKCFCGPSWSVVVLSSVEFC